MDDQTDNAKVRVPPPIILLVTILIGVAIDHFCPIDFVAKPWSWIVGLTLIGAGLSAILYCSSFFKKNNTDIKPWKPTTFLIQEGLYQFSRNPIYLSFVLILSGAAFIANSVWLLLLGAPFVIVIDRYVIAREEEYLLRKFGDGYAAYLKQIRRWL